MRPWLGARYHGGGAAMSLSGAVDALNKLEDQSKQLLKLKETTLLGAGMSLKESLKFAMANRCN